SPNIIAEVDDPISALGLVAAGTGVAMIQQSLKQQLPKNVTTLSLIPLSYNTSLWVAWHNEILRPLVKYFQMKLTNKV
ncbi:MAG TPA: LysR family transcriptional regulator, partial [Shewanella frigidimarina]|nr:LysR family transcriptional regulator [Shewanella frigidimarina]